MASLNRVLIIGNLGQDPELRYTQNQTAVATLNVATTDVRTDREGKKVETTEWHRVIVWNKQAENCSKYLAKGRAVFVEGRLQTRSWEDKTTGQKRYTTEIVAQNVQFLGGSGGATRDMEGGAERSAGGMNFDNSALTSNASMSGMGGPETAGLDDIPF